MLPAGLLDPATQMPRSRLFWVVLGLLIVGQIAALWMLCSDQVRKAEARETRLHVQQLALADCLQYIPGATITSCTNRIDEPLLAHPENTAAMAAVPVRFSR